MKIKDINKKNRSYGRFWIYHLISTANPALILSNKAGLAVLLAGRSKTAHRVFFLINILISLYFLKYETIVRSSA